MMGNEITGFGNCVCVRIKSLSCCGFRKVPQSSSCVSDRSLSPHTVFFFKCIVDVAGAWEILNTIKSFPLLHC